MTKRSNTSVYLVAMLLFVTGVGYMAYSGFSENSVYFLNVSEVLTSEPHKVKSARLFGTVAAEGLARSEDGTSVRFMLADKDEPSYTLWVNYAGALPDTFKEGAEVIVEGGMEDKALFKATSLMTKCPSKYQKENRG